MTRTMNYDPQTIGKDLCFVYDGDSTMKMYTVGVGSKDSKTWKTHNLLVPGFLGYFFLSGYYWFALGRLVV
jgi:hypothetical protein